MSAEAKALCFGIAFVVLGALALNEKMLKHAMHVAATLGLLGFLAAAVRGLPKLLTLLQGGEVDHPLAVYATSAMAGLCLVFVLLCVKSFLDARRRRAARGQTGGAV